MGKNLENHCCERMDSQTGRMCDDHEDPYSCPDYVISYIEKFDEYGLIIHDGGRSSYRISYCPFCGSKLPESKRDRWYDELEALGFDDPNDDEGIPEKYKTSVWYENP